jgi:succinate dehydrogenase / fumarate reductase, cytochrome b subunit
MTTRMKMFASSVGLKFAIALTGLALVGFLISHLVGNLLFFAGPETYNSYSHKLITNPLLIPAELGLLAIFLIHVYKSVKMFADNQQARPSRYQEKKWAGHTSRKSVASTTMIVSGLVTFAFVILHLKTFKYGPEYLSEGTGYRDLYRLMAEVFSNPLYVVFYVICMVLIGFHLRHGISSAFQSLGIDHPRYTGRILAIGTAAAIAIAGGFAIIPVVIFVMGSR